MTLDAVKASGRAAPLGAFDFARQPFVVIWETTQACDLACVHCRASATPNRDAGELRTTEAMELMRQVRAFADDGGVAPLFILTGGDPLKRPDILPLVEYGAGLGLRVAMTPSGTPLMTRDVLRKLRDAGLARLAVSLDGASRAVHDTFRRVPGSFDWTMQMLHAARELGLPTQVNTTITRRTIGDLEPMSRIVADVGAVLWSVFLVVPTGRAGIADLPRAAAIEQAFEWLAAHAERAPHDVKSTAAPHYRRVLLQRQVEARRQARASGAAPPPLHGGVGFAMPGAHAAAVTDGDLPPDVVGRAKGVNDGNGFVFVSHRGTIYPSGFLPEPCGNVRMDDLRTVYRTHPTFLELRDPAALKGKCGACDFRHVCGGSRARAYALTGDWLEADPACAYESPTWQRAVAAGLTDSTTDYFAKRIPEWQA